MTVFYKNYLSLCAKANKTPSAVATAVGLSNAAASGWKKGKEPSDTTLQKLADYFDVTVEALTEEPKNKPALPQENELDNELIELLTELRPDEVQLLVAYAQGIIAARKNS